MSPQPARFSAFDDLAWTAQSGGPGLARATLKVQSELFVQSGGAENASFLPLALTLLPLVDEATAREIAQKLGPYRHTPPALVEALYARGGGVAETVIELVRDLPAQVRSASLDDGDPRLPVRLAGRDDLSEAEQIHLMGRAEPAIMLALAQNLPNRLSRPVAAGLIKAARDDEHLARVLLARSDIDAVVLTPLYIAAGSGQRSQIRSEIMRRIMDRSFIMSHRDATDAELARLMEASLDGMARLISDLASVSERDGDFVEAAAMDASRELVALSLVGLGLQPEDTTRILLRTGDPVARDSRALHALVDVVRTTDRSTAEMIVGANWPRQRTRVATQHIPVMAPGGNTSRGTQTPIRKTGSQQIIDQVRSRG